MARRRKDSDPGLAIIQAIVGFCGFGLLFIYMQDPVAGRALFKIVPWLVLTVAVVGGAIFLVVALISKRPDRLVERSNPSDAPGSTCAPITPPQFPKVQADFERERVLTLEDKLERLDWFQFEKVVAMLYSSRGCRVERRGGANPDGGIDIVVHNGASPFAVQCKYWKAYKVGVRQVRELLGALQDARIPKGVIASFKGFTDDARELATRNNVELIGKSSLLGMLNEARFTPHFRELNAIMDGDDKYCPRCERPMSLRTSSKDGSKFWGCSGFPRCKFTMNVGEWALRQVGV